jgi:hypothetical protein
MKSFIAIIMMFLFISDSKEFIELHKLPLLVQHYYKHKAVEASLSLFQFLKQHYIREIENDNDDKEDNSLPFKSVVENNFPVIYLPAQDNHIPSNDLNNCSFFNAQYAEWKPFNLIFPVFHPPRYTNNFKH